MNYSEQIKQNYQDKYNIVGTNLRKTQNLFPHKEILTKPLDSASTLILQTLFKLRVGFLEEFTVMFSLLFYKQKFEKVILELERLDMISSKQTPYGKAFILTSTSLHFLYTKDAGTSKEVTMSFSADSFPSDKKLMTYKVLNGIVANRVFEDGIFLMTKRYNREEKSFRTQYTKRQYLTNFVYKENSSKPTFSKKELDNFIAFNMDTYFENPDNLAKFHNFVKCYKQSITGNGSGALQLKNAYLRDYISGITTDKEQVTTLLREIICRATTNMLRDNPFVFWQKLYAISGHSSRIMLDFNRFYNEELLRNLSITKRSLLASNKNSEPDQMEVLLDKIENLDAGIVECSRKKDSFDSQFEVVSFKGFSEADIAQFEAAVVTMDTLKRNSVYISNVISVESEKPLVSFAIPLDNPDTVTASALFRKLEYIYLYHINNLVAFDYDITIYTYYSKDRDALVEKLRNVTQLFKDIGSYSLLIPKLLEASVESTEIHPSERFQVFQSFAKSNHFFE